MEIAKNLDEGKRLYRYEKDEDDSESSIKTIYYKDLGDENADRIFEVFNLLDVYNSVYGDGSVSFWINPTDISDFWDYHNYFYGFYYT